MARRTFILSLLIATLFSLAAFTLRGFGKEQRVKAQGDLGIIAEKVEEILKNQQDIIGRLEDIRGQQDIIRIRASRR